MEMGGGTVIIVGMILCFVFFNDTSPPERRRHQITQVETTVPHWRPIALLCRGEVEPPWAVSQEASPWWWPRAEDLVITDMQASLFLLLLEEE